ncbi:hypothetical protein HNR62_000294 [Oceanisphaera litoralis]|uniref:hypothetical protein n=1 Tax=Oceanisphaera litoralis TaxID=225144 RepID=UPI00195BD906|nr:hypothetical protein [Oceanisphaera litoralis]MBM7454465.1 hypothetical protein [Oceanisphaera litoralis]
MPGCSAATPQQALLLREGIRRVLNRIARHDPTFDVGAVLQGLDTGAAELILSTGPTDPVFFLMIGTDDFPGAWYCVAGGAFNRSTAVLQDQWDALAAEAKLRGYRRLIFSSARRGWQSKAGSFGFRPQTVVYGREV